MHMENSIKLVQVQVLTLYLLEFGWFGVLPVAKLLI
jgi:hypothetical protein